MSCEKPQWLLGPKKHGMCPISGPQRPTEGCQPFRARLGCFCQVLGGANDKVTMRAWDYNGQGNSCSLHLPGFDCGSGGFLFQDTQSRRSILTDLPLCPFTQDIPPDLFVTSSWTSNRRGPQPQGGRACKLLARARSHSGSNRFYPPIRCETHETREL